MAFEGDLNIEAMRLWLGLPGTAGATKSSKRGSPESPACDGRVQCDVRPFPEARSPGKRSASKGTGLGMAADPVLLQKLPVTKKAELESSAGAFLKVSVDCVPCLRKVDLKRYRGYPELVKDLEDVFKLRAGEYSKRAGHNGSEFVPTYEDKDGDWMLVGDVPRNVFVASCCKRLRIMKGSEP